MEVFKGRSAFPGIATGKVLYYSRGEYQIRRYLVNNVKKELTEFRDTKHQIEERLGSRTDQRARELLSVIKDKAYAAAVESMIENQKVQAGYAVQKTRDELCETFGMLSDDCAIKRMRQVREISALFLRVLGQTVNHISFGDEAVILAADHLTPTEILEMEKDKLLAVVTVQGSEISHTAIMAKTINIPALYNIEVQEQWDGRQAILDGYSGTLYIDPDSETLKEYHLRKQTGLNEREELLKLKEAEDKTLDGKNVGLFANIGNLEDLDNVKFYGARGIGLLRSEFQYLAREHYPREDVLFQEYKNMAEAMGDYLAVIRTVDLGADKRADYMEIPDEENPIMGNRGIRLCLDRVDMFKAQLRAIYRASVYGNLAVMFPMVTYEEEIRDTKKLIGSVQESLGEEGIPFRDIPIGIMVETPAAVMMAHELVKMVDFVSVGTNDLTQYTLAMDRQNPVLQNKYDDHHPSVLKMIRMVADAAHKEGKQVYICGELAADTALTETFVKMGVDALSVVPACILPVRKAIRSCRAGTEQA